MRRMSSSVAMSPAITAAGSPGVRYRREKTTNATTAMTTMVENRRRTMYAIIGCLADQPYAREPIFLFDVPHERDRRDDDAVEVRPIGGGKNELCGWNIWNEFERPSLDRVRGFFRAGRVGRRKPCVSQLLDLRILRPAEPRFLTRTANGEIDRGRGHIGADERGVEDRPAALLDRLLRRASRDQRAPVACLQVDVETELAQHLRGKQRLDR